MDELMSMNEKQLRIYESCQNMWRLRKLAETMDVIKKAVMQMADG